MKTILLAFALTSTSALAETNNGRATWFGHTGVLKVSGETASEVYSSLIAVEEWVKGNKKRRSKTNAFATCEADFIFEDGEWDVKWLGDSVCTFQAAAGDYKKSDSDKAYEGTAGWTTEYGYLRLRGEVAIALYQALIPEGSKDNDNIRTRYNAFASCDAPLNGNGDEDWKKTEDFLCDLQAPDGLFDNGVI